MIQPAIEQNQALVTHDLLPEVYGDPTQISHVFAMLVDNSIKFRSEQIPRISVTATTDSKAWVFSVSDNGIGIDLKHVDRIFGVFKRVYNDQYPGAGMGLPIARRIMKGTVAQSPSSHIGRSHIHLYPAHARKLTGRVCSLQAGKLDAFHALAALPLRNHSASGVARFIGRGATPRRRINLASAQDKPANAERGWSRSTF
jgi:signal transduction histidine kinase